MWIWQGIARMRLREFVSARDALDLALVAFLFACLLMLSACSATLPASPTIPPLPKAVKDPPRPFRIFAVDLAEVRRDGRSPMIDVTEDMLWAARQAGELSTELHAHLASSAKRMAA